MMYRRHHGHGHNSSNMSSYNCGGSKERSLISKVLAYDKLINCFSLLTQCQHKMDPTSNMSTRSCTQPQPDRKPHKCIIPQKLLPQAKILNSIYFINRSYPVYAVGDYAGGQQYYATTASNFTTSSSSSNGNANSNSYIVPVDDSILGVSQSRGSPHSISTVSCQDFCFSQFCEDSLKRRNCGGT